MNTYKYMKIFVLLVD